MGMNTHKILSNKVQDLLGGATTGNGSTFNTPAPEMAVQVETAATNVDIEVSNDGTNWYAHPDASLTDMTDGAVYNFVCYFRYIRASIDGTGASYCYISW